MISADTIKVLARKYARQVLDIRRHLHQNPELSFQEFKTSDYIQQQLSKANISFTSGYVKTGVVALIKGNLPHTKTILLRADMDALPIQEKNKVAYASINEGIMHACGHDVHSACALGAAIILNELKENISGTIKIMFQPGEEVLPGGASLMIKEGVLDNPKVDKAIALHVFPSMQVGKLGFKTGMYMASTDELYLTVNGKGGHAAMPSEYINPLLIASEILLEINNTFMVHEFLKGTDRENIPTVVAFGKIIGNGATNVIPDRVEIAGTFRTMNEVWREKAHQQLRSIVNTISKKYGVASTLRIEKGYPFLVNDTEFTNACVAHAQHYLGSENVEQLPLRMTAEDFAFISQQVPSCFFRLGTGNVQKGITSGVHTPTFDIDEDALEIGTGTLAWLAIQELHHQQNHL
jgi:amidohydrolase